MYGREKKNFLTLKMLLDVSLNKITLPNEEKFPATKHVLQLVESNEKLFGEKRKLLHVWTSKNIAALAAFFFVARAKLLAVKPTC